MERDAIGVRGTRLTACGERRDKERGQASVGGEMRDKERGQEAI